MKRGRGNGATSGVEYSPARAKRRLAGRQAQDRRWAAKAGPVEVRKVDPPQP